MVRRVVSGMETLRKMEKVETTKEGIFVKPKERITILSSYVKSSSSKDGENTMTGEGLWM